MTRRRSSYYDDYWPRYEPTTPIEVKDGIKAKSQWGKFVQNWWAERWITALKNLLADSEMVNANTRETRLLLTDAMKSFESNEFDKVDAMIKDATKKLYQEIDPRMEDEIRRARNQLVELKARGMNITPMITVLKSARTLMLSKDYAQALKELREFKEQVKKAE